jgi:hypothetical protein
VLREQVLGRLPAADLNGSGTNTDDFPVVVVKATDGWVAFIDTNLNGSFDDETPVHDYRNGRQTVALGTKPLELAANFEEQGGVPSLDFEFDNAGHGTHVAGVAAGHNLFDIADFDGVAPGAQLVGLKITDNHRGGMSVTGSIVRALAYAARFADERGLRLVLNLSFAIGTDHDGRATLDSMVHAFLATRPAQRPTSRWAVVALGAAQPLIDPRVVLDAGYQLSVVGVTSMIAAGRVARRIGVHRLPPLARAPALILVGPTVATIGSAPIVAWVFGRISLAAPLTNLVATPLLELAQPMLFVGMLLAPIHPLASLLADAAHPLLGVSIASRRSPRRRRRASSSRPSGLSAIAAVLSAAFIVACASRGWRAPRPGRRRDAGLAACRVRLRVAASLDGELEPHMIDVSQENDAAHAAWPLDSRRRVARGAARAKLVPYRASRSPLICSCCRIRTRIVGGAATVRRASPRHRVDAGFPGAAESYRASLDAAARPRAVGARPPRRRMASRHARRVSRPTRGQRRSGSQSGERDRARSLRQIRMLLMGDAEQPEESGRRTRRDELHADVLKVSHHGSAMTAASASSRRSRRDWRSCP